MKTYLTLFILGFLLFFGYPILYYSSVETVTVTITDKERDNSIEGDKYMIYSNDMTFKNVDSWLFLKFNSSDIYGKIQMGKTYKIKRAGWRVQFLSMYPNIISIAPLVKSDLDKPVVTIDENNNNWYIIDGMAFTKEEFEDYLKNK